MYPGIYPSLYLRVLDKSALLLITFGLLCTIVNVHDFRAIFPQEMPSMRNLRVKRVFDAVIKKSSNFKDQVYPSEMTLITAFFDIGQFPKGNPASMRKTTSYYHWAQAYGYIDNPLLVFTDSPNLYDLILKLRERFPKERTIIYLLDRTKLWSFSLARSIKKVFKQPGYPVHYPNTMNENYTCIGHAKYELVHAVVSENIFKSPHYSWIDIGYFRNIADQNNTMKLQVPTTLNNTKVAYGQVYTFRKMGNNTRRIITHNMNWIACGMFIGTPGVLYKHTLEYMNGIQRLLKSNLMGAEQQDIYYMYQPNSGFEINVQIQTFTGTKYNPWFNLGFLCRDTWLKRIRKRQSSRLSFTDGQI